MVATKFDMNGDRNRLERMRTRNRSGVTLFMLMRNAECDLAFGS
jgi:hypothetical protein